MDITEETAPSIDVLKNLKPIYEHKPKLPCKECGILHRTIALNSKLLCHNCNRKRQIIIKYPIKPSSPELLERLRQESITLSETNIPKKLPNFSEEIHGERKEIQAICGYCGFPEGSDLEHLRKDLEQFRREGKYYYLRVCPVCKTNVGLIE